MADAPGAGSEPSTAAAVVAEIVEGSDAPHGLPDTSKLALPVRAVVEASALFDLGLRTSAASLVSVTALPRAALASRGAATKEALAEHARLAAGGDPDAAYPRPARGVEVRRRAVAPLGLLGQRGRVDDLSFESAYRPAHPDIATAYLRHRNNRTGRAQHWRHSHDLRPTIIVVHGFMGSPYWLNSAFFSLPWFFSQGYDVLLVTLPHHGRRKDLTAPFSGHGYFAGGLAGINESVLQSIHDLRVLMDHLEERGVSRFGATGLSLGGYTTALLAAVEDRLSFAIPNSAVTDLGRTVRQWAPAGQLVQAALPLAGLTMEDLDAALAVGSPLSYPARVPKAGRFVIAGLGDRLAPPEQSRWLWEHWERCALHWFPGNHTLHVNRAAYLRRMGRFLNDLGFGAPSAA